MKNTRKHAKAMQSINWFIYTAALKLN